MRDWNREGNCEDHLKWLIPQIKINLLQVMNQKNWIKEGNIVNETENEFVFRVYFHVDELSKMEKEKTMGKRDLEYSDRTSRIKKSQGTGIEGCTIASNKEFNH